MSNSDKIFEFSTSETVKMFNILAAILHENADTEDKSIENLQLSIYKKLQPYIKENTDINNSDINIILDKFAMTMQIV